MKNEFARKLGFDWYEDLTAASHPHHDEGDTTFFVTWLPDGRWAAWDDYELALDRVEFFATREEAEASLDLVQAMDRQ